MYLRLKRRAIFISVDVTNTIWYAIDERDIYLQFLFVFVVISEVHWHGT